MGRLAGRLLVAVAAIHILFGVWFGGSALVAIARDGFFNAVAAHQGRQLVFWFIFSGVAFLIVGQLACWAEAQGKRLPAFLGWEIALIAITVGVLLPASGWFLMLPPAALILVGSRHRTD